MIESTNAVDYATASNWGQRGEYWRYQDPEAKVRGRKPRFLHKPLILIGHGVRLRVDRGTLLVRNGFTHYPQQAEEVRFFPRDKRLPSRIVVLDSDGAITFDALEWLSLQGVPLVQINWLGEVVCTGGGLGYCADPVILRIQLEIQDSPFGMSFARHLIASKIENSIDVVNKIFMPSPAAEVSVRKLQERLAKVQAISRLSALLWEEAHAAIAYFSCWRSRELQWQGVGRRPIPEDWRRIGARMTTTHGNQFARHPVNAILNYSYGILESQVRATVLAMGFDPTIGALHAYEAGRSSLIFDLMEPCRPIVDRKILQFLDGHTFHVSDFTLSNMGVCKLHPQFARYVVKLVQDLPEVEAITTNNLRKMLALHPEIFKKAGKNISQFKARAAGRRG